jgi:hypothetical protein
LIQRAGRIDRIGTDFETLFVHNFFPEHGLDVLLNLVSSLETKIRQIDATIGLDASVLGEAINPKVFNTLKRIQEEDESAMDEEEADTELESDEGLGRHLAEFIRTTGGQLLKELPDGIHSGRILPRHRGMFLYYQRRGASAADTDHFWRYYDTVLGDIEDNRLVIAERIKCAENEPRVVDPELKAEVHQIMQAVETHIVDASRQQAAMETAPAEVSEDQNAVLIVLQQLLADPSMERARLLKLHEQLSRPLAMAPVKQLRKALQQYRRDRQAVVFVNACEQVAAEFGVISASIDEPGLRVPMNRSDLRLICFEFIS